MTATMIRTIRADRFKTIPVSSSRPNLRRILQLEQKIRATAKVLGSLHLLFGSADSHGLRDCLPLFPSLSVLHEPEGRHDDHHGRANGNRQRYRGPVLRVRGTLQRWLRRFRRVGEPLVNRRHWAPSRVEPSDTVPCDRKLRRFRSPCARTTTLRAALSDRRSGRTTAGASLCKRRAQRRLVQAARLHRVGAEAAAQGAGCSHELCV